MRMQWSHKNIQLVFTLNQHKPETILDKEKIWNSSIYEPHPLSLLSSGICGVLPQVTTKIVPCFEFDGKFM